MIFIRLEGRLIRKEGSKVISLVCCNCGGERSALQPSSSESVKLSAEDKKLFIKATAMLGSAK